MRAAQTPGVISCSVALHGAADSDVVYVRGWRLRKLWLWQALAAACLALFVIMGKTAVRGSWEGRKSDVRSSE